jgi:hypothetical protein
VFEVEAFDVIDLPVEPGADYKLVARKIRLVREVKICGNQNTGHRNTGNLNTGHLNTGNRNTGHKNTGDWNAGHKNTGNRNTGLGCVGDRHTGYFCSKPAPVLFFDKPYAGDIPDKAHKLADLLASDAVFDYSEFSDLPNATTSEVEALHQAHIKARKALR